MCFTAQTDRDRALSCHSFVAHRMVCSERNDEGFVECVPCFATEFGFGRHTDNRYWAYATSFESLDSCSSVSRMGSFAYLIV